MFDHAGQTSHDRERRRRTYQPLLPAAQVGISPSTWLSAAVRREVSCAAISDPAPERPRTVAITSSDGINDSSRPWLLGIELRDPASRSRIGLRGDLSKLYRAWIGDRVGDLDTTTLSRLDGTLRAVLNL